MHLNSITENCWERLCYVHVSDIINKYSELKLIKNCNKFRRLISQPWEYTDYCYCKTRKGRVSWSCWSWPADWSWVGGAPGRCCSDSCWCSTRSLSWNSNFILKYCIMTSKRNKHQTWFFLLFILTRSKMSSIKNTIFGIWCS